MTWYPMLSRSKIAQKAIHNWKFGVKQGYKFDKYNKGLNEATMKNSSYNMKFCKILIGISNVWIPELDQNVHLWLRQATSSQRPKKEIFFIFDSQGFFRSSSPQKSRDIYDLGNNRKEALCCSCFSLKTMTGVFHHRSLKYRKFHNFYRRKTISISSKSRNSTTKALHSPLVVAPKGK